MVRRIELVLFLTLASMALGATPAPAQTHVCVPSVGDVVILPGARLQQGVAFAPECVVVDDGTTVTWTNLDAFTHDPVSKLDRCFQYTRDHDGARMPPKGTYSVTFHFDGTTVLASTTGGTQPCSAALIGATTGEAAIHYHSSPLSTTTAAVLVIRPG